MQLDLIYKATKARKSLLLHLTHIYLIINETGTIYTGHFYVFKLYIFTAFFLSQYIYWYYKDIYFSLEFIKSQMITNQI
jgi:hypothetical protein